MWRQTYNYKFKLEETDGDESEDEKELAGHREKMEDGGFMVVKGKGKRKGDLISLERLERQQKKKRKIN